MKRRNLLRVGVQGGLAFGVAKALHNTVMGFGQVGIGGNLKTQDLDAIAAEHLPDREFYVAEIDGYDVTVTTRDVRFRNASGDRGNADDPDAPPAVAAFASDIQDLRAGSFAFRFSDTDGFFSGMAESALRAPTVEFLRGAGYRRAEPSVIETFADADPRDPEAVLYGLVDGFRAQSRYDIPRYLAGSVQDNLLPVDADLREPFRPEEEYEELLEDGDVGLFCGEYTRLANRAIQAVPATEQSIPMYGLYVRDRRHKHAYNAFGTARRRDGMLELPITFVDYTDTTLYDDLRLTRVLGEGFDAYDEWHRADDILW